MPATTDRTQARRTPDVQIPVDQQEVSLQIGRRSVRLTNLDKPFWPALGLTKRDLLQYYATMAHVILPHVWDRAMVMKRFPNGAGGKCFFMKHTPSPHPDWLETCSIEHDSGNIVDFPLIQNIESLLWVVNLGCIDLNQWYSRCDDVHRPDFLHFDLDPGEGAPFERVLEVALIVRNVLHGLELPTYVKTSGATGVHVYVPIVRGPLQKQVWHFAKATAQMIAAEHPEIATAEYIIAKRPHGRVFVDYNQNAWGKTLASVYSVRPTEHATVSAPVTWDEIEHGIDPDQFRLTNMPARLSEVGDLWKGVLAARGRARLEKFL